MVRILLRVSLVLVLLLVLLVPAATAGPASKSPPPALTTLQPGGFQDIHQRLTVNVVFVGYDEGDGITDIDEGAFLAGLPGTYDTVSRYPALYGLDASLGLQFSYDYNLVYADAGFEDAFFGYLGGIATPAPTTLFQSAYNDQSANYLDVTDNRWIDAPSVEQWLADNMRGAARRRHRRLHHLPGQLVRALRLPLPRLHQDRRARPRHGVRLRPEPRLAQGDRLGRHDTR